MEVPSHLDEPEAYVPPEPDADDDWPPASREAAIEYARQVRSEEGGLAIDDATLERVADVIMDPPYPEAGQLCLTAEELADDELVEEAGSVSWGVVYDASQERAGEARADESRHFTWRVLDEPAEEFAAEARIGAGGGDLFGGVHEYLRMHLELNGGTRLGWRAGRRTLVIGLVGDAEAHKAALSQLGGERVMFEHVPRTVRELEALADRIIDDGTALQAAGYDLLSIGRDPQRGVVHVELVSGRGAEAARDYFTERYGDAVAVEWLGPRRDREVPYPFGSWTSEGRVIRVFFGLDRNSQRRGAARIAEESGERIVIALSCRQQVGLVLRGGFQPHFADLELAEPVGNRAVIDASAGAARPSLAQLRSR